jgi:galactose mutarotase-like enzyme
MTTIQASQAQYLTYTLSDGDNLIEVVPERGGILTRWQTKGREMFYLEKERFTDPSLSVRGGNPVLFPICGNMTDNQYSIGGKPYSLKQHGFAREMAWTVIGQTPAEGLTMQLTNTDETRSGYPFDFELTLNYQIVATATGSNLVSKQVITNRSAETMPVCLGFHPYFAVADKSKLSFDLPGKSYYDQRRVSDFEFAGDFDFDLEEIDAFFSNVGPVSIVKDGPLTLKMEATEAYKHLVFWTVKGKDFYCLEPWSATRNAFNTGNALDLLPGESVAMAVTLMAEVAG